MSSASTNRFRRPTAAPETSTDLPYRLGSFTHEGVTLSYEVHGTGSRTLVYMHGLLLDSALNRRLAQDLALRGYRVILFDLPGHGRSDKPRNASSHRIDAYARRVIELLDHLGIKTAVIGGVSLGADVTLEVAYQAPERVQGMILEMPVLENAAPVAAMLFTPLLIFTYFAAPVVRFLSGFARRIPRQRLGIVDSLLGPFILEPEEMTAVLHGVLLGPVAPTSEERSRMSMPALVIGHRADRLHPFRDASRLCRQLPNARLAQARSSMELRVAPNRLTSEIAAFLHQAWGTASSQVRAAGR